MQVRLSTTMSGRDFDLLVALTLPETSCGILPEAEYECLLRIAARRRLMGIRHPMLRLCLGGTRDLCAYQRVHSPPRVLTTHYLYRTAYLLSTAPGILNTGMNSKQVARR